MFRFETIELLWLLLGVPLITVLYLLDMFYRKRALERFGDKNLVSKLQPDSSSFKRISKLVLLLTAFSFFVIAAANPQIGTKMEKVKRQGIELMIALDVSNSMLAEDIKPSRIERAKQSLIKLIDALAGDRIGIVIFAGDAFLLLPMTSDYSAAKLLVSSVSTDLIQNQGTALGNAIEISTNSFSQKEDKSRALIIISDGENHEDNALAATEIAAEKNIQIYTIGMGSKDGAPIPKYDALGNQRGFKKDKDGNIIMSKLNAGVLQQIANEGNGQFAYASNAGVNLNDILDDISGMKKEEYGEKVYTDYDDKFQLFLIPGILLLLLELLLSYKKNKYFTALNKFASGK